MKDLGTGHTAHGGAVGHNKVPQFRVGRLKKIDNDAGIREDHS
jgi:hypothetical protein